MIQYSQYSYLDPASLRDLELDLKAKLLSNLNDPVIHLELAKLFFLQGRTEWACSAVETSLKLNPESEIAHYLLHAFRKAHDESQAQPKYKLIHIGKSGGTTLRDAIKENTRYYPIRTIHIKQPSYAKDTHYFIVARDPVARCISAFNWRQKLLAEDEMQRSRFEGEYEALKKYKDFSELCEKLYNPDGSLNQAIADDFENIHHLKERIEFYLKDFLKVCPATSIIGVLMTETLSFDIERLFGIPSTEVGHQKRNQSQSKTQLSSTARRHLVKYILPDYHILSQLSQWGFIDKDLMSSILDRAGLPESFQINS